MSKGNLCSIPHVVSEVPNDVDLAIINSALYIAINIANREAKKITQIQLISGEHDDNKTIQVKIDYERQTSESIKTIG